MLLKLFLLNTASFEFVWVKYKQNIKITQPLGCVNIDTNINSLYNIPKESPFRYLQLREEYPRWGFFYENFFTGVPFYSLLIPF